MPNTPLWSPSAEKINNSHLKKFMTQCGHNNSDYQIFWKWSVDNNEEFWNEFWDYADIIGSKGDIILKDPDKMTGGQFFPNGKINYTENLLRKNNDDVAIVFRDEKGNERSLTFCDLYNQVSLWIQAFENLGITKGDRVAAYMPNIPETVIACLATAALGAVWSSASPDFGAQGIIDRFEQINPKLLITVDGYYYNGKDIDCLENVRVIQPYLKSLEKIIVIPFINSETDLKNIQYSETKENFLKPYKPQQINFRRVDFNHPLFIMFSSGTTGKPKCIVHGHGGTLLQHIKEHQLQCDFKENDPLFYFTTCGWMMWNWQISALYSGCSLLLYDGNPFYPNGNVLWDYTTKYSAVLFGTSAKYIEAMKKNNIFPKNTHNLNALKIITSTGSPLVHESFDFVYEHIKQDIHLASISGGTDIISCFMLGNPISPVYRGELQGAGLGMAVEIFDENENPIPVGKGSGELICTKPFPSMPTQFWNDDNGKKYKEAYFDRYKNVWCHGDWVERTDQNGYIIHGRSDATLNPGGVRIGTAEIYRQVEKIDAVLESVAIGQNWQDDIRILLFVVLRKDIILDDSLTEKIKKQIRHSASPRHVPAKIIQVTDIPRTKSGKITELAIRDIIHGRPIKNKEALANPEALEIYANLKIA